MGRASAGMKWLAQNTSFNPHSSELDSPREKLLAKMCSAMEQNRPVEASTTFFTWNNRETAKLVKEGEALLSKGESVQTLTYLLFAVPLLSVSCRDWIPILT
jgi:hypothetical protein